MPRDYYRQPGQSDTDFALSKKTQDEQFDREEAEVSKQKAMKKPVIGEFPRLEGEDPVAHRRRFDAGPMKDWRGVRGYEPSAPALVSTPATPAVQPMFKLDGTLASKPIVAAPAPVAELGVAKPAPIAAPKAVPIAAPDAARQQAILDNNKRFEETKANAGSLVQTASKTLPPMAEPAAPMTVAAPKAELPSFLKPMALTEPANQLIVPKPQAAAPAFVASPKPAGRDRGLIDADIARLTSQFQGNMQAIPANVSQQLLELEREKSGSTAESRMAAGLAERAAGAARADAANAARENMIAVQQRAKAAAITPAQQAENERVAKATADKDAAELAQTKTKADAAVASARGAGVDAAQVRATSDEVLANIAAEVSSAKSAGAIDLMKTAAELSQNDPKTIAEVRQINATIDAMPAELQLRAKQIYANGLMAEHKLQMEQGEADRKGRETEAKTAESGQNAIEKARENALASKGFTKQTDPETKAIRWYKGNVLVEPGSAIDSELSNLQAQFGAQAPQIQASAPASTAPSGRPRSASGKFEWDGKSWVPVY